MTSPAPIRWQVAKMDEVLKVSMQMCNNEHKNRPQGCPWLVQAPTMKSHHPHSQQQALYNRFLDQELNIMGKNQRMKIIKAYDMPRYSMVSYPSCHSSG